MNIKRIMCISILCTLSLCATEIKVDGSYSKLLGNPFKAKLETKTQSMSIISSSDKIVNFTVETNKKGDFGTGFSAPTFSVKASDCNNILKTFFAEDYNIVANASKTASCEILPSKVTISYVMDNENHMNQISDIVVDLNINLTIDGQGMKLSNTMNKDLNKSGSHLGLAIRAVWNPDYSSMNENVHKILEYAIYDTLNKNFKGLK